MISRVFRQQKYNTAFISVPGKLENITVILTKHVADSPHRLQTLSHCWYSVGPASKWSNIEPTSANHLMFTGTYTVLERV